MQTALKRCVGANDEPCKFPECHCAQTGLIGLPVIDIPFMDSQINGDSSVEMTEPIASVRLLAEYLKIAALVIVLSMVLAATLFVSAK